MAREDTCGRKAMRMKATGRMATCMDKVGLCQFMRIGKYTYPDGSVEVGMWENDLKQGRMVLYTIDGNKEKREYHDGERIK